SVARDVRHQHDPVPEEPVRSIAVPAPDQRAVRPRPYRRVPALVGALKLETGAGGHVPMPLTVDVEGLAEAESELTIRDGSVEATRQTPPGTGSGAGDRGPRRTREREAGSREAAKQHAGRQCRRESASPARACRRRRVLQ